MKPPLRMSGTFTSGRVPGYLAALLIAVGLLGCSGGPTVAPTPTGHHEIPTATPTPPVIDSGTAGITDERVLFGQSAAFTGPAAELGTNMRLGIEVAFHEANQAGGVHGRLLELTSLDDSYEPEQAVTNTLQLIEDEQVFMLIGAVGTPTSRSATRYRCRRACPTSRRSRELSSCVRWGRRTSSTSALHTTRRRRRWSSV